MTGYIEPKDRKKIMLIADTPMGISGVANVIRNIITGTAHRYNFIVIGVSLDQSIKGKKFDISQAINAETGLTDSNVITVNHDKYDDVEFIRQVMIAERPAVVGFQTDPRYFTQLFEAAHEIQHGLFNGIPTPLCYLSIWDEYIPPHYNRAAWSSVNISLCISKQTKLMNEIVLGEDTNVKLEYFPHGVDIKKFKPLPEDNAELVKFKKELFKGKEYDFVLFFNSRNIQRKNIPTALLAFKALLRNLPQDEAKRCCFVLHTQPVDNNGTDLPAVIETIFGKDKGQIIFDNIICPPDQLNWRYNLADATVLISEAEGFGLSGLESIAAGTPVIINMTGGMQDYANIRDDKGNWFTPSREVWSNHNKTYKNVGEWVYPVWPSNLSIVGSVPTPYIFASRADFKDVAFQMLQVYNTEREVLKEKGLAGRKWIQLPEVAMTTDAMCFNFIKHIDNLLEDWEPLPKWTVTKVDGSEVSNFTEIPDYLFEIN